MKRGEQKNIHHRETKKKKNFYNTEKKGRLTSTQFPAMKFLVHFDEEFYNLIEALTENE